MQCGHTFCHMCWNAHVMVQLENKVALGRYNVYVTLVDHCLQQHCYHQASTICVHVPELMTVRHYLHFICLFYTVVHIPFLKQ